MAKISEIQAQEIVDNYPPLKRCENSVFCYWHCAGSLDGYIYRSGRVDSETLAESTSLDDAKTWFKNYFKTLDYRGVKPTQSDEVPTEEA